MPDAQLTKLELLAEIDTLVEDLQRWAEAGPPWEPARTVQALIRRLLGRVENIRIKLESPLVVATLGGTGTGKSSLLNAILGDEVLKTGVMRPTTCKPILVCRADISPEMLGISPDMVEVLHRDLPVLSHVVLIDCPDPDTSESTKKSGKSGGMAAMDSHPDTSESAKESASNLARLRQIVPHCDVLLVTGTQQKYRSGRVAEELASLATGARLIFVQTHADTDDDIRHDWQKVLQQEYAVSRIFRIDSVRALEDVRCGRAPQPEMAELLDLLTRQLSGTAVNRIRRANLLDLAAQALQRCQEKVQEWMPAVEQFRTALRTHQQKVWEQVLPNIENNLKTNLRYWEKPLLGEVIARWGNSPWAWVLRIYQSLGMVVLGMLGRRLPGPAPWLVWGAAIGWEFWRRRQAHRGMQQSIQVLRSLGCDTVKVQEAAFVLRGYALEAGLDPDLARSENLLEETKTRLEQSLDQLATQLEKDILRGQADRHSRWYVRWLYNFLFGGAILFILFRLGKNYFWDSWLDPTPDASLYGIEFYLTSLFWLLVWTGLLLWVFLGRLRKGLSRQILAGIRKSSALELKNSPDLTGGLFGGLEQVCQKIDRFREELTRLQNRVEKMRRQLAMPEVPLGRRRDG